MAAMVAEGVPLITDTRMNQQKISVAITPYSAASLGTTG
jgi:hypothetical protein